ncbi:hypothetical protein ES703_119414 [subsurface metagenome]
MRYHDEIYSEVVPFNFIKYIIFIEGGAGVAFLVLYIMQLTGSLNIEDDLPAVFFLIMAIIMLAVAAFLFSLTKLRVSITSDSLRASFGFIKFEVPLNGIEAVYTDEKSSLKYGGWGVRLWKQKEGWVLAYTTIGYKRVVLELKGNKYKKFIFSTAHPEEVINIIQQKLR